MPGVMSSITGALGKAAPAMQTVTGITGTISNLINSAKQRAYQQRVIDLMKQRDAMLANPALYAQKVKALMMPLTQAEVQGITNSTQAALAERGLSSSPQISQMILQQAMAPLEEARIQDAIGGVNTLLGSQTQAVGMGVPNLPTDTSGFWRGIQGQPSATAPIASPDAMTLPQNAPDVTAPDVSAIAPGSNVMDIIGQILKQGQGQGQPGGTPGETSGYEY